MKFLLNSSINTLPTQDNLYLWNKSTTDKCFLCKNRDSTCHTLSNCSIQLNQGRYTWRHDNIVKYIYDSVDKEKYSVFADLEGCKTENGKTIPVDIHPTGDRPDIVVIDRKRKVLHTLELTVPFERNIDLRHTEKTNRYAYLITDVKTHKTNILAFEIGARGHVSADNKARLKTIHSLCSKDLKLKTFIENISALAITGSYVIFCNRKDPTWSVSTPFLKPLF